MTKPSIVPRKNRYLSFRRYVCECLSFGYNSFLFLISPFTNLHLFDPIKIPVIFMLLNTKGDPVICIKNLNPSPYSNFRHK